MVSTRTTGSDRQPDMFDGILPPQRALVQTEPARRQRTEQTITGKPAVDVEPIGAAIVKPTPPSPPHTPAPMQRAVMTDNLTALVATHEVEVIEYDAICYKSVRIKRRVAFWSRKRTLLALGFVVAGIGLTSPGGAPWLLDKWQALNTAPPKQGPLKGEQYGPPKPAAKKLFRKLPARTAPTWLERQFGTE